MLPIICIYAGGVLTILMALFHTRLYRMFDWKEDLKKLSRANSRILYTIHLALLLLFFMIGTCSIIYAGELSRSIGLSAGLNTSLCIFWLWRFIWQLAYFKSEKGQRITAVSLFLSVIFALLWVSYFVPLACRFLL